MYDVFISWSGELGAEIGSKLADLISGRCGLCRGYVKTYFSKERFVNNSYAVLNAALESCKVFIGILTNEYYESQWTPYEFGKSKADYFLYLDFVQNKEVNDLFERSPYRNKSKYDYSKKVLLELIKEIDKRYSKEPNEGLIEQLIEEKWNVFDASIVEIRRKAIVDKATQSGILNTNR